MTLDKWTVSLAALGVVSLASVARAEEQASSVLTSLSQTTISGYVDTAAHWNLGNGNANNPPYRFNDVNKADGFNLNVVQIRIDKPLDEYDWAAGYRVDLWAGPDAGALGTQSGFNSDDFAIRQAYVALRAPIGNGIDLKMGVFDSIVGYESIDASQNPNYTRSYGNTIEPTTHTGVLASYRFSELLLASFGVADTMGPVINSRAFAPYVPDDNNPHSESYKTYMGSVAITAPESLGFLAGSTLYLGVVNGFNNDVLRSGYAMPQANYYAGATLATPVTGLRLGFAVDLADADTHWEGEKVNSNIMTMAGYASFQASKKLSLHGRAEWVHTDADAYPADGTLGNYGPKDNYYAFTATAQYDLWKNVISRLEFRWDVTGDGDTYGGATPGQPDSEDAFLIALNVIYRF